MKLQSGGLSYHAESNAFSTRGADLLVSAPETGFMFPAFEEGGANIYRALYFTKKTDDIGEELIGTLFGETQPVPADAQQQAITDML